MLLPPPPGRKEEGASLPPRLPWASVVGSAPSVVALWGVKRWVERGNEAGLPFSSVQFSSLCVVASGGEKMGEGG